MGFKRHLMEDEGVIDYCTDREWTWVCTDKRVLKFAQFKNGGEKFHDISYGEISGISLTRKERELYWLVAAIVSACIGVFSLILSIPGPSSLGVLIALMLFVISATCGYAWYTSGESYFQLRGQGLLRREETMWKINESTVENYDSVIQFVKAVRSQL